MLSTDSWITLTQTESTNTLLLNGDYPSGTMVTARHQSKGKGRLERRWNDLMGHSFLFSVVLEFDSVPQAVTGLPLFAGLCVLEAAESCLRDLYPIAARESKFSLKWPNDVLLTRQGQTGKLAGILLESRFDKGKFRVVTGIGMNWSKTPYKPNQSQIQPIALFPEEFPQDQEPEQFIGWLIQSLNSNFYSEAIFTADIKQRIEERSYLIGKKLNVPSLGKAEYAGLTNQGAIQLRLESGNRVVEYDRTDEEIEIL